MINNESIELSINDDWKKIFKEEFSRKYFNKLIKTLNQEFLEKTIYPQKKDVFKCFENTSLKMVKVVIIGQDPYHGFNQANGLCFSVNKNTSIPPSLKNIFKEVRNDIGCSEPKHGDLSSWSRQGVLLLNSSLTVEKNNPGSHSKIGWEIFTNKIISSLSVQKDNLVFMLWGKHAIRKEKLIYDKNHLILKSPHPSPLSAYRGFFGCKHFSKTNLFLKEKNIEEINWQIN